MVLPPPPPAYMWCPFSFLFSPGPQRSRIHHCLGHITNKLNFTLEKHRMILNERASFSNATAACGVCFSRCCTSPMHGRMLRATTVRKKKKEKEKRRERRKEGSPPRRFPLNDTCRRKHICNTARTVAILSLSPSPPPPPPPPPPPSNLPACDAFRFLEGGEEEREEGGEGGRRGGEEGCRQPHLHGSHMTALHIINPPLPLLGKGQWGFDAGVTSGGRVGIFSCVWVRARACAEPPPPPSLPPSLSQAARQQLPPLQSVQAQWEQVCAARLASPPLLNGLDFPSRPRKKHSSATGERMSCWIKG